VPVITSQLAGNASSRLLPGGPATGAAVQFRLLRTAGIDTATATSGMTAAGLLQLGTTLALPAVALPFVVLGGPVPESLLNGALVGALLFVVLVGVAVAVFTDDHLLRWLGRAIDVVRRRRHPDRAPIAEMLLAERTSLRTALGDQWERAAVYSIGRAVFDFLTLMTALAAFGSDARPSLVLLAYATAMVLGMIPLTPGGLGFVEAGLTAMLALAGVSAADAVGVALLYRLMSFWLPIPVGLAAAAVHRRRYGSA
jgi:uncharacterized protein (TIRG00374 family)